MNLRSVLDKIPLKYIYGIIVLITVAISLQCYLASAGKEYTRYNNYMIFINSFKHLLDNSNLYVYYPKNQYDLFKYSPTFALFMGLFYCLPHFLGLLAFNLLNAWVFVYSITRLKFEERSLKLLLLFLLIEMFISETSSQTNLLMAGLLMLAFTFLEDDRPFWAALFISCTVFIKLFGILGFALWLLYPNKIKFLVYGIFWCLVLALLPMVVVSKNELVKQYLNWQLLLKQDHDASYGISFIGWMRSWFGVSLSKIGTVAVAAILFCAPLVKLALYRLYFFRVQILASVLLWVVIFNHKGESPTYIIAMAGVGIWYFSQQPTSINTTLLWCCLLFTSFSSTDLITPGWIANKYVEPYCLKAVFCSIIWFKLIGDLLFKKPAPAPIFDVVRKMK